MSPRSGFSLIELLVSVGLFAVVMVVSVGTLLALVDANQKAQTLKVVINNLNFTLDSMTRTIRTGHSYYCGAANNINTLPTDAGTGTHNCPTGNTGISFIDDQRQRVGYRYSGGSIERKIIKTDGSTTGWIALTSSDITIEDARFYVTNVGRDDDLQPIVTISIRGDAGLQDDTRSTFDIQSTVTQRVLDI